MYYVFDRKPLLTGRWIDDGPFVSGISFGIGQYLDSSSVPVPLKYELKRISKYSEDHGPYQPAFLYDAYPLFRDDLVAALKDCGVNNIQVFDALVHDPETGEDLRNYKAVNIIGAVAAADMAKSDAIVHSGPALFDVEFDKLVIDPTRARNLPMFRLAEATGTILVHERVRDCLIKKGFDKDLEFFEPGEVAI